MTTKARDAIFTELYRSRAEKQQLAEAAQAAFRRVAQLEKENKRLREQNRDLFIALREAVEWDRQRPGTAMEVPEWVYSARNLLTKKDDNL